MTSQQYKYTGALPYAYDETGALPVLLGREATVAGWSESNKLSDFGGSPS